MDWLRSEDLKEEKNVTAPIIIIAVEEPIVVAKDYDAYHWTVSEKAGGCVWAVQRIRSDGEVSQATFCWIVVNNISTSAGFTR